MLQRGPVAVGDLKPIGTVRPLMVVRPGSTRLTVATISMSCLSTLAMFGAGAAWLAAHGHGTSTTPLRQPAPVASTAVQPPTFPSWIEVPHLTGPLSRAEDPDTFAPASGARTFLDPDPADTSEPLAALPPRANPHLPLISRAPLDVAHLTYDQPPVWRDEPQRREVVPAVPPSVVATVEPDTQQPLQGRSETRPTQALPANPVSVPIPPPGPAPAPQPTEAVVRPAPPITAVSPPERMATLGADPAQPVVDRGHPTRSPRAAQGVVAPILSPGPARHARLFRRPRATATARAPVPYRDAEETASILGQPRTARTPINAGAVAHASLHRSRADRSATPSQLPALSAPWTLPSALAPTD